MKGERVLTIRADYDFSKDNTWMYLSEERNCFELKIEDSNNNAITLNFNKSQFKELLQELLHNEYFEADEEGELVIANL